MKWLIVAILMVGMIGWTGCGKDKAKPDRQGKDGVKPDMALATPEMATPRPRPGHAMRPGPVTLPRSHRWRLTASATGVNPCAEVPPAVLAPLLSLYAKRRYDAALAGLKPLLAKYPQSARARVLAGGAALYAKTPDQAQASKLYEQAIALHDKRGCHLTHKFHFLAVLGTALARMQRKDYAGAKPWLSRGAKIWPKSATIQYNYACALCMSKDVDGCYHAYKKTLELCATVKGPSFPGGPPNMPVQHYVKLAQKDSDLATLRVDPRYAKLIAPKN